MSDKPEKTPTCAIPIWGLCCLPKLVKTSKEYGYALTLHGSFARDFDFVAIPWTEEAKPASVLAEAIRESVGGVITIADTAKPHGRRAWAIMVGNGPYIDLSVMPRVA